MISANFDYRIPEGYFDNIWTDDWGINFILTYNSGRPYTSSTMQSPPRYPPINDRRYPDWLNVDMRLYKNFTIHKSIKLGIFWEWWNILNDRTLRTIQE